MTNMNIRAVSKFFFMSLSIVSANQTYSQTISLEQIMADPDWIGRSPQRPYWSDDSRSVYFSQKRQGAEQLDLYRLRRDGDGLEKIAPQQQGSADVDGGSLSPHRRMKVYERAGAI